MFEDTYPHRDMRFFKDETKGDHMRRMRRAERYGNVEKNIPLRPMMAEYLVEKNVTAFATMLQRLGLRFRAARGVGADSFFIEV